MTAINNSLADISFFNFQSDLEGPHGSVHVAIGGNMGAVPKAALDACFWLHHANIDRLWEAWLRKCGGRSNPPASDPWMSQQFTFYDENGVAVNMTGSQVINTASTLNYRYDFPLMLPCDFKIHWPVWKWKWWEILRIPKPVRFTENITRISFKDMPTDNLKRFIDETKTTRFNFSQTGPAPDRLFIVLEGLKAEKLPEGSIEVYLNLKPGETPSPKSASFAGVLDLFSGSAMHSDHNAMAMNNVRVNLSTAAANLKLTPAELANAELSFVVRGNSLKGREVKTSAAFSVASLAMGVEKGN
jgi:tyrosinase